MESSKDRYHLPVKHCSTRLVVVARERRYGPRRLRRVVDDDDDDDTVVNRGLGLCLYPFRRH